MKKTIAFLLVIGGLALLSVKARTAAIYTGKLVNQPALATSNNYNLDMNGSAAGPVPLNGIASVAVQAVASTVTYAPSNFTDGETSTGSFTVGSLTGLSAAKATDTLTAPSQSLINPVAAFDHITVSTTTGLAGQYFTLNGQVFAAGRDWFVKATSTDTALSIQAALQNYGGIIKSTCTLGTTIVYATSTVTGYQGNAFTWSSSTPTALSVATPNFTGGRDDVLTNAVLTINGRGYLNGRQWNEQGSIGPNNPTGINTSTGTALSWANLINTIPGIIASTTTAQASGIVASTATVAGSAGNAFTFAGSTVAIGIGSANFTGGYDNAFLTVGGKTFTANTDWTPGGSTGATATAIAAAVQASSATTHVMVQAAGSVVNATSTITGINPSLLSSTASITPVGMTGGMVSAINTANSSITIPNHDYGVGLAVLYNNNGGVDPANLTTGTTYYAIPLTANSTQLAVDQPSAIAGTNIVISSYNVTGGDTFTFTPVAFTGTPGVALYGSNDGVNFNAIAVSSFTFSSPYPATTTLWDLGSVNYRWLQANVVGPTTGAMNLVVTINGKDR